MTLDPLVRRARLGGGQDVLLVDTVGFIQKLPHQLVAAFRATLEEVTEADLLLHVMDASADDLDEREAAVNDVLQEIGAAGAAAHRRPEQDATSSGPSAGAALQAARPEAVLAVRAHRRGPGRAARRSLLERAST